MTSEEKIYWRKGAPPQSGFSKNHQTGELEVGVSFYRFPTAESFAGLKNAAWYRIVGVEVGTGSDGKPVVRVVSARKATQKEIEENQPKLPELEIGKKILTAKGEYLIIGKNKELGLYQAISQPQGHRVWLSASDLDMVKP
ncbi:MAG: hypothetical protein FWF31_11375 [Desulfobulbus sp.]|nr:hypothetical protein [Desulfobulbus sp.]